MKSRTSQTKDLRFVLFWIFISHFNMFISFIIYFFFCISARRSISVLKSRIEKQRLFAAHDVSFGL